MTRNPAIRALALAAPALVAACGQSPASAPSLEYYRTHPAEWERAIWLCTNEPPTLEDSHACVIALQLLRSTAQATGAASAGDRRVAALGRAVRDADR
jgi:hypothetical protein